MGIHMWAVGSQEPQAIFLWWWMWRSAEGHSCRASQPAMHDATRVKKGTWGQASEQDRTRSWIIGGWGRSKWNVRSSMFGVVIGERRPAKSPRIDGVFCRVRTNARAKLSAGWSDETTAHRPQRKMRGAMTTLLICHPRGEEWTCLITRRTWGTAAEILPRCKRTMKALDVGGPFCAHRERAV
ncbi:hypothetical protein CISG_02713 [Coccidioides immitis RMSCC 3703]|uniref:Uncharacterized protein n=1 Tax=Coccidioides immitis RMSCC 3703 TaxID=454286 RepID=A0A0J8RBB1_COCIT|nr:hypothetical protein CISG_02713 [Coccidioides immitis RMSCC 3703]